MIFPHLLDHIRLFAKLLDLEPKIETAAKMIAASMQAGGKLMLCGNGGSAADCQHLAAEFVGRFERNREPLPAIALTTDTSALTAIGNDYEFASIFDRQVKAIGRPGDVLIGISTSGRSSNVSRAFGAAKQMGIGTIALYGRDGGPCHDFWDLSIIVPGENTARIQEAHIFLGHVLCGEVERLLGLA